MPIHEDSRFEYTVRTCDCDDTQELEDILNEMSSEAWELYALNEIENDEGELKYLCIFHRETNGFYDLEDNEVANSWDFKTRMKKLIDKKSDSYEECRFIQKQIREKNKQIQEIKNSLDSLPEEDDREELNRKFSEKMGELKTLRSKFSEITSPSGMYGIINYDLLTLEVSYELADLIDTEKDGSLIAETVKIRQKLTDKTGYVIPRINFMISDDLNENEYKINIRGLKAASGVIYPKYRRFFPGQSNLESPPENAVEDIDPITRQQVFWLEEDATKSFWDSGMSASQVIASHLESVVYRHADDILNYEDILNYITLLGEKNFFLADYLFEDEITLGDLRYIFAELIREKVSVKDVLFIFEKLNDLSGENLSKQDLLKELRVLLKRHICADLTDSSNTIYAFVVPEKFKSVLAKALKHSPKKEFFKDDKDIEKFVKYVTNLFLNNENNSVSSVLICEPEFRKPLFNLFKDVIPELHVISEDEIAEEVVIQEI